MGLSIFGAGVLGGLHAVKLLACGHEVTVLARGRRATQLRADGLVVSEHGRGCLRARVAVIESLDSEAFYDQVLVFVRHDQTESVLPALAASKATHNLLIMFNNLAGPQRLVDVLGRNRIMLGFPGPAGEREADRRVMAAVLPTLIQKTTLGELDGRSNWRIRALAAALKQAGFPTAVLSQLDAWLNT